MPILESLPERRTATAWLAEVLWLSAPVMVLGAVRSLSLCRISTNLHGWRRHELSDCIDARQSPVGSGKQLFRLALAILSTYSDLSSAPGGCGTEVILFFVWPQTPLLYARTIRGLDRLRQPTKATWFTQQTVEERKRRWRVQLRLSLQAGQLQSPATSSQPPCSTEYFEADARLGRGFRCSANMGSSMSFSQRAFVRDTCAKPV